MKYSLRALEPLASVPTIGLIIEQIDQAATMATAEMRRYGIKLYPRAPDVPLQDEVDDVLRSLVVVAYGGWMEARDEAPASVPDWQVEGYESDDHFDVTITGLEDGGLTCRISRRLVG